MHGIWSTRAAAAALAALALGVQAGGAPSFAPVAHATAGWLARFEAELDRAYVQQTLTPFTVPKDFSRRSRRRANSTGRAGPRRRARSRASPTG